MPEQLSPELVALRQRCQTFAQQHMLPLAGLDSAETRSQIRQASKAAGLFELTQPGTGGDNPYLAGLLSTDPAEAAVAAARSITLGFSSTGCFEIEFRIFPIGEDAPTNSESGFGRNFLRCLISHEFQFVKQFVKNP